MSSTQQTSSTTRVVRSSSTRSIRSSSHHGDGQAELKKELCRETFMAIAGKDRVIQRKEWKNYFAKSDISSKKSEGLWKRLDKNGSGRVTYAEFDEYISASIDGGMKRDSWLVKGRLPETEDDKKHESEVHVEQITKVTIINDGNKETISTSESTHRSFRNMSGTSAAKRDDDQTELKKKLCREAFMEIAGKDRVIQHKEWIAHFENSPFSSKQTNGLWNRLDKNRSGRTTYAEFDLYICDSIESGKRTDEWLWKGRLPADVPDVKDQSREDDNIVEVDSSKPNETKEKTPEVAEQEVILEHVVVEQVMDIAKEEENIVVVELDKPLENTDETKEKTPEVVEQEVIQEDVEVEQVKDASDGGEPNKETQELIEEVEIEYVTEIVSKKEENKEIFEVVRVNNASDEAQPNETEFLEFVQEDEKDVGTEVDEADELAGVVVTEKKEIVEVEMTNEVAEETKEIIEDDVERDADDETKPNVEEFLEFAQEVGSDGKTAVVETNEQPEPVTIISDNPSKEETTQIVVTEERSMKTLEVEQKNDQLPESIDVKNLYWSAYALIIGFGIWVMWAMVPVRLQITGFDLGSSSHTADELKTMFWSLPAIAGLSGATMQIVNGLIVKTGGGRNVMAVTATALMIPAIGLAITAEYQHAHLFCFSLFAALSGIGGGFYVSSMMYILTNSFKGDLYSDLWMVVCCAFFGIVLSLILIPIVVCFPFGRGFDLTHDDWVKSGSKSYLYMAGWIWVPLLFICVIGAMYYMTPKFEATFKRIKMIILLMCYGLAGCFFIILGGAIPGYSWLLWVVIPFSVALPVCFLTEFSPEEVSDDVEKAYGVLKLRYTWVMAAMSLVTIGSFIGFAFSMPKLIIDVFGYLSDGSVNSKALYPSTWAFLGPLAGVLTMLLTRDLSRKLRAGSRMVTISTILQIVSAVPIGISMILADDSEKPEKYFVMFFLFFVLFFIACGIGIVGLTQQISRMTPAIFEKNQIEYVLWVISCIGCFGAFLIPASFGLALENHNGSNVMFGFTVFYCICLAMHIFFFERKGTFAC